MNYRVRYKDDTPAEIVRGAKRVVHDQGFLHFFDQDDKQLASFNLDLVDSARPIASGGYFQGGVTP